MLSAKHFRLGTEFAMLLLLGLAFVIARSLKTLSSSRGRDRADDAAIEIAGYRSWTKVNAEPYLMQRASSLDCAAPTQILAPGVKDPHQDKFVTVYVNDI